MPACKICKAQTEEVISLGKMPIANGFLENEEKEEYFFPLKVVFCPECFMVQLADTVPSDKMFHGDYHFISSTSQAMAAHFQKNSDEILEKIADQDDPFVVELGCNDGIMLKHIAAKGIRHLGIEPSENVAGLAKENGVEVAVKFFNKQAAEGILEEKGPADVICGSNVFCHIEDLNSVFEGISVLLKDSGYVYFEDPYLLEIVKKSSFDQIYDEHVYYFSGLSVRELALKHGLELVDMVPQEVHGGSMRYYLMKGNNPVSPSVEIFIQQEKDLKLDRLEGYQAFKKRVDKISHDLKNLLVHIKRQGHRIVGYGATSKSTTLLNYAQIGPDTIDFICDTTPTKIGKLTPGMHIPVKDYQQFQKDNIDHALLLAWNHKKEIFEKEHDYRKNGGKFITYFPEVMIE